MSRALSFTVLTAAAFLATYFGFAHIYDMGAANAATATAVASPDDGGFLALLMTGKYLAAVGAFLVLAVAALRSQLAKVVPWFATKLGGYVLGFGSAFALYVGTAWQEGAPITLGLFAAALAAGWAAAGGWESLLDLINLLRGPKSATPVAVDPSKSPTEPLTLIKPVARISNRRGFFGVMAALGASIVARSTGDITKTVTVHHVEVQAKDPDRWIAELDAKAKRRMRTAGVLGSIVLVAAILTSVQACTPAKTAGRIVIDCTLQHQDSITVLTRAMLSKVATGGTWEEVEFQAKMAGVTIGGCALAGAVQEFLGGSKGLSPEQSWPARNALDHFRTFEANGATFHTDSGDL